MGKKMKVFWGKKAKNIDILPIRNPKDPRFKEPNTINVASIDLIP
jgi:hypothetical protein